MDNWDGIERRTEDRKSVYEQLGELRVRMTHIEDAVQNFSKMKDDLHTIKELMQQAKGAFTALKTLAMVVAPVVAVVTWIITHVDWTAK